MGGLLACFGNSEATVHRRKCKKKKKFEKTGTQWPANVAGVEFGFTERQSDNIPLGGAAPLLCAGNTVYSPMKYFGLSELGTHLGVVGHVAVIFAKAFGLNSQVRMLLDRAHAVSKLWNDAPVVICGDFNCTPKLDLTGLARDQVSGQSSAEIRTQRPYTHNFRQGKRLVFVTNNSTKSRKQYGKKFEHLGLSVTEEEIFASSFAAVAYLQSINFPKDKKNSDFKFIFFLFGGVIIFLDSFEIFQDEEDCRQLTDNNVNPEKGHVSIFMQLNYVDSNIVLFSMLTGAVYSDGVTKRRASLVKSATSYNYGGVLCWFNVIYATANYPASSYLGSKLLKLFTTTPYAVSSASLIWLRISCKSDERSLNPAGRQTLVNSTRSGKLGTTKGLDSALVVDPVMVSTNGDILADPSILIAFRFLDMAMVSRQIMLQDFISGLLSALTWDTFNNILEQTPPLNGGKLGFYYKEHEILPPLPGFPKSNFGTKGVAPKKYKELRKLSSFNASSQKEKSTNCEVKQVWRPKGGNYGKVLEKFDHLDLNVVKARVHGKTSVMIKNIPNSFRLSS
ncbi:hypothetical protein IFM89_006239 [Coptis chinensis]|uniref:Endonuclease/exonuclease/phosphatase domain-containing protein n=1 Tax=Coptis chinensis TaxID=261450 RepID=A0A835IYI3_9MAGN|nr:hypothetical protein IFM89_006239 [Coptis chinensis]